MFTFYRTFECLPPVPDIVYFFLHKFYLFALGCHTEEINFEDYETGRNINPKRVNFDRATPTFHYHRLAGRISQDLYGVDPDLDHLPQSNSLQDATFPVLNPDPPSGESVFNVYDFGPILDLYVSPELIGNVAGTNFYEIIYFYTILVTGFSAIFIYINPDVWDFTTNQLDTLFELNIGEHADGYPGIFRNKEFYEIPFTAHETAQIYYYAYDSLNHSTKTWYLIYNLLLLHQLLNFFLDPFTLGFNFLTSGLLLDSMPIDFVMPSFRRPRPYYKIVQELQSMSYPIV
jgi:hypothetical protein